MLESGERAFRVRSLSARPVDLPLLEPFGIAGGAQDVARNVIVEVELEGGARGIGEAAPFPAYNGETREAALEALGRLEALVVGQSAGAWRRIAAAMAEAGEAASARCAIETALLDALTRAAGLPLAALFGGVGARLETDVTVTTGDEDAARAAAGSIAERGYRRIKIKVGGSGDAGVDLDRRRVLAVAGAAKGAEILLDANGGFGAEAAVLLVFGLGKEGVRPILFEQPVAKDDLDGARRVRERTGIPVAADESATSVADVRRLVQARAADVVNIKITKSGVAESLDMAIAARAAGLGRMIGGLVEGEVAMSASAGLASGLGGFSFVDLDTPLFLAESPFEGGLRYAPPEVSVAHVERGHGARLSPAGLLAVPPRAGRC